MPARPGEDAGPSIVANYMKDNRLWKEYLRPGFRPMRNGCVRVLPQEHRGCALLSAPSRYVRPPVSGWAVSGRAGKVPEAMGESLRREHGA